MLESTNLDEVITGDIDTSWSNWQKSFLHVMESCIPKVTVRTKRNLPWLSNTVVSAINKRNLLFRAAKKAKAILSEIWSCKKQSDFPTLS